jgi:preprotein translocase subunit YajC
MGKKNTKIMMAGLIARIEQITDQVEAHQKRMEVKINAWRKEIKADREATEDYLERTEYRIKTGQKPTEAEIRHA